MKFKYYEDLKGEWRWRLLSKNGRIIADSSEGYSTKYGAHRALGKVLATLRDGDFEVIEPMPEGS